VTHQASADPYDVRRHRERNQRIEPQPAGEVHQAHSGNHPGGRPDIREQMVPVGLERDAAMLAADTHQEQRRGQVDGRGDEGQSQAEERRLQRLRLE
jgi:hypothetical protein